MQALSQPARTLIHYAREDRGKIFFAVSAGWFLSIGVRMAYPVILPFIRIDFGLSLTMAGFLLTVLWLAYAIGQIPGGVMGDRFGEGVTMAASMILAAASVTLVVIIGSTIVLFVGTLLLGVAIALFGTVRLTSLADVYPKRVGTVHGLLGSVGDIGNTLLPLGAGVIAAATAWQIGLGMFIPLFVLASIAIWVFVPKRTSTLANASGTFSVENARHVFGELRQPALVLGTVIMVIGLMISQAFTGFYPTYLIEEKGLSGTLASGLFALFFALGAIIRPFAGNAYDQIGVRRSLMIIIGISGMGLALLPFIERVLLLAAVTVLIAFIAGRGTIVLAYMTMSLSAEVQNTGLGIVRTLFFFFGALSPVLFGAIADLGYFDEVFLLLAGLSGLTILVILRLPRSHS